jgi:hypothetical protein
MRLRLTILTLLSVLGMAAMAGTAHAQSIDSPYRFINTNQTGGFYTGYLATGRGSLDLGPESGILYGVRYDISIGGPFALEGDIGYFSRMRAVYDTVPEDTSRTAIGESGFTTLMLGAGLRFNLTGPRTYRGFQPYALFGLGFALDLSDDSTVDSDLPGNVRFDFGTSFMGMLGGGAEFMLGDRYSLRIDLRNILWKLETPQAFLIKGDQALLLPGDEWAQNFGLTAGLAIRF